MFNGLANTGGSLRQLFGIGGFNPSPGVNCQSGTDANPAPGATIFAGRLTTPTFGLGLVELIPDGTIQGIAAAQPAVDPRHRQHDVRSTYQRPVHARADAAWRASAGRPFMPAWPTSRLTPT